MNAETNAQTLPPRILHGILSRADDPVEMGNFVVAEVRRLTQASCAVVFECLNGNGASDFHVLSVAPPEHRALAESAIDGLCRALCELHGPACLPSPENRPHGLVGPDPDVSGTAIAVPLKVGSFRLGALVARGVPTGRATEETLQGVESLASILALVLRNAFLCRTQADLIEEQTLQLRESNEILRQRETEFRALADNQPDLIMRFDREGRHLYANTAAERFLGMPRHELAGRTHRELGFPASLCEYWEERIAWVFETGKPVDEEFAFPGADKETVFNWRLFPETGSGRVETVLSVARDITEHRRAEQSYRQLFGAMLDGLALHETLCDGEGVPVDYRFLSVNPAFERLTGLRAEDLIGRTVLEVLSRTEPHWIETYAKIAKIGERAQLVHETAGLRKHFEVQAFRPTPGHFAVIFSDVTERMHGEAEREDLERRLRQAQKMEAVGTLAGGIAHDFNNILTPIMAHTDLARMSLPANSPLQSDLSAVLTGAERAAGLVRQILALSRRAEHSPARVSLTPLVKETLKLLRSTLPSTIEIREEFDPQAGPVFADPVQLHQVLLNLCTNARDAMDERGGVLTVRVGRTLLNGTRPREHAGLPDGAYTSLSVTDTGVGMAPETVDRIFEPYFTTKAQGTGTGFGLAVVHGIVRLCGGDIVVKTGLGQGSTFAILLPESPEPAESPERRSQAVALSGRGRVLLVDDEDSIVAVGGQILRRLGYDVTALRQSDEALALFRDRPADFDLVVTDQTMPKITGVEVIRQVLDVRPDLPVVITTGFSEHLDEKRALALGACELVTKPFTSSTLGGAVKRALARRNDAPSPGTREAAQAHAP